MYLISTWRSFFFLGWLILNHGCGGAGSSSSAGCSLCGPMADVGGAITGQFVTQDQMQGWNLALIEKQTGVARVAEVDATGLFQFKNARTSSDHTLVLYSPEFILQSVLSVPSDSPEFVHQFFSFDSKNLPRLIHSGPILRLQDQVGVSLSMDLASDQTGDGIPDGMALLQDEAVPDLDLDGILNDVDPDIDGDGAINLIDPDDDGDGIYDVLDSDANGDFVNDSTQTIGDPYFSEGVEFIGVQFELRPKTDGSGNDLSLVFTTKVREDVGPLAVQIRGAPFLLNGATVSVVDSEGGEATEAEWDRRLLDEGTTNDSTAGDRIFAQTVKLATDKQPPRPQESIFFQLAFGSTEEPWFVEFPFVFPPLTPAAITSQYISSTRNVQLVGNPFGAEQQDFVWSVQLIDKDGLTVWSSQSLPGTTRIFAIPDGIMVSGETYKYSVVAQVLDKVPGYPIYTIHSPKYDID